MVVSKRVKASVLNRLVVLGWVTGSDLSLTGYLQLREEDRDWDFI